MHTIKIIPNLLFEYQCTSGKFIRLPNRIESNRNFFLPELECSTAHIVGREGLTVRSVFGDRTLKWPTEITQKAVADPRGERGAIEGQKNIYERK